MGAGWFRSGSIVCIGCGSTESERKVRRHRVFTDRDHGFRTMDAPPRSSRRSGGSADRHAHQDQTRGTIFRRVRGGRHRRESRRTEAGPLCAEQYRVQEIRRQAREREGFGTGLGNAPGGKASGSGSEAGRKAGRIKGGCRQCRDRARLGSPGSAGCQSGERRRHARGCRRRKRGFAEGKVQRGSCGERFQRNQLADRQ